jgi:hypothetical protein
MAKNYPPGAELFVPRPFRSKIFLVATGAFCGFPIIMLLWDVKIVGNLDFEVVLSQLLAVFLLAIAWWQTYKIYTSIHRLFDDGRIEKFEENSALDKVLISASKLIIVLVWVLAGAMCAMSVIPAMIQHRH